MPREWRYVKFGRKRGVCDLSLLPYNELAARSEKWNGRPRLACVNVQHPLSKTEVLWALALFTPRVKGNGRADRLAIKATAASGSCLGRLQSVEELETPPARTEPRTSHHRSPGGERRGMKKRCIDDLP